MLPIKALRLRAVASAPPPSSPPLTGLVAWYDASDLSTLFQDTSGTVPVTTTGQDVRKMLDKSGLGNHLTFEAGLGSSMTYQNSGGLHWVQGQGSAITCTAFTGLDSKTAYGIYGAMTSSSTSSINIFNFGSTATPLWSRFGYSTTPFHYVGSDSHTFTSTGITLTNPHVFDCIFDGAGSSTLKSRLWCDAVELVRASGSSTDTTTLASMNLLRLLTLSNTGGDAAATKKLWAFAMYDQILSGADLTQARAYLAGKSGVTLPP